MTFEYSCIDCEVVTEKIQPGSAPAKDSIPCPYCGGDALFKFSAPAVLTTGGATKKTFDVAVGEDSAKRWKIIHDQQATRNKVRQETGSIGLEGNAMRDVRPVTPETLKLRAKANDALAKANKG